MNPDQVILMIYLYTEFHFSMSISTQKKKPKYMFVGGPTDRQAAAKQYTLSSSKRGIQS